MLSIQYYPFGCQNGQQNRQHTGLRISSDSLLPMRSVHAVHFAIQSSFQAQNSTTTGYTGNSRCTVDLEIPLACAGWRTLQCVPAAGSLDSVRFSTVASAHSLVTRSKLVLW